MCFESVENAFSSEKNNFHCMRFTHFFLQLYGCYFFLFFPSWYSRNHISCLRKLVLLQNKFMFFLFFNKPLIFYLKRLNFVQSLQIHIKIICCTKTIDFLHRSQPVSNSFLIFAAIVNFRRLRTKQQIVLLCKAHSIVRGRLSCTISYQLCWKCEK